MTSSWLFYYVRNILCVWHSQALYEAIKKKQEERAGKVQTEDKWSHHSCVCWLFNTRLIYKLECRIFQILSVSVWQLRLEKQLRLSGQHYYWRTVCFTAIAVKVTHTLTHIHTQLSFLTTDHPALTVNLFFTLKFVALLYGYFIFDNRKKLNLHRVTV